MNQLDLGNIGLIVSAARLLLYQSALGSQIGISARIALALGVLLNF
jgi:hypothetical protein